MHKEIHCYTHLYDIPDGKPARSTIFTATFILPILVVAALTTENAPSPSWSFNLYRDLNVCGSCSSSAGKPLPIDTS